MRIPGSRAATMAGRWLRSRLGPRVLILGYHRVASVDADPHHLAVGPASFAEQLEALRRHANPIGLRRLVSGLRDENLPAQAVALTFDDGYADVLHVAAPLLERHEVPATVFVTTGNPGREFWWDEAIKSANNPGANSPALTSAELSLLSNRGLIEIGAHTVTHPILAELSESDQTREVVGSKGYLEDLLGVPVVGFSYPHGSVSARAVGIVRQAGFHYACCSTPDTVRPGVDLFELPRFWIPDWDGDTFSRWLRSWL